MKSILAVAVVFGVLSLCNLTDKSKPEANSNASNQNGQQPSTSNRGGPNDSGIDRAALTVELMKLEYELTTASFNGDISTLATYVADDYSGTRAAGVTQNKNQ